MTTTIAVHVELFGLARRLSGERTVTLDLPGGARLRDVVRSLAVRYPALVGPVVSESGDRLAELHLFHSDGLPVPDDVNVPVRDGQTLALIFVVQGG